MNLFEKGCITAIAGGPASGKTQLALYLACGMANKEKNICYMALEDTSENLLERLDGVDLLIKEDIDLDIIDDKEAAYDFQQYIQEKSNNGTKTFIIDYCQLLQLKSTKTDERKKELAEIINLLKKLTINLNISIILLCQMTKGDDGRQLDEYNFDRLIILR